MKSTFLISTLLSLIVISASWVQSTNPVVVMETSMGAIKIQLNAKKAPITVKNFLDYVDAKHYNGTIFHRVIGDFMIQGGGYTTDKKEKKTKAPIKNESFNGLSNKRGAIAMARTPVPDSATAQFFINVVDNEFLDKEKARDKVGYCVFGKVIDGMDVVDKIRKVKTENQGGAFASAPVQPVVIETVRRVKN